MCKACENKISKKSNKIFRACLNKYRNTDILNNILLKEALKTKKCSGPCKKEKQLTQENFRLKGLSEDLKKLYWCSECKTCETRYEATRDQKKLLIRRKKRWQEHNEKLINDEKYREQENKKKIEYKENIRKNNKSIKPSRKIHCALSKQISNNINKNYISFTTFVPYTIDQLKEHLEALFEPWMNWNNYGRYMKSQWSDNEPSSWRWQIDHIIPHSEFSYTSMEDEEFQKCWALSNLRPLSAKQNLLDGIHRTRHQKKKAT